MVLIDNPPTKKLIIGRPINHAHVSTGFLPAPTPDKYPATVALITSRELVQTIDSLLLPVGSATDNTNCYQINVE